MTFAVRVGARPSARWVVAVGLVALIVLGTAAAWIAPERAIGTAEILMGVVRRLGFRGAVVFAIVQVLVAVSGVLPASLVGVAGGAIYGLVPGFLLTAAGTLAGALLSFFISRSLFRAIVERLAARRPRFRNLDARIAQGGWKLVCLLRVSPVMPFSATSLALGLSAVGLRDYTIGTLASLPAMFGYVFIGTLGDTSLSAWATGASTGYLLLLSIGGLATLTLIVCLGHIAMKLGLSPRATDDLERTILNERKGYMNLAHPANGDAASPQITRRTHLILCLLLLLVPVGQLLLHSLAGSGLWQLLGLQSKNIDGTNQHVGILYAFPDNLQYASLAMENSLGNYFMSNLYTTESHLGILVNLYFLSIGILSNWFSVNPIPIMILVSFAAPPIVGYMIFTICSRIFEFSQGTSLLATALVIFGSGPSLLLSFINVVFSKIGVAYAMPLGLDYYRTDLFPIDQFLVYPYQSIATALLVTVLSAILKTLRTDLTADPCRWTILSAGGIAVFSLVRPYEAFVLTALFLITMLISRLIRGKDLLFRYRDYLVIGFLVTPSLFYISWLSFLPGWRNWAHAQFLVTATRTGLVAGLSAFWFIAITGVIRAARERRLDMLILCLWVLSTMLLLIGFGGAAFKLAGGAVIAYGILGAFGLEKIFRRLAAHPRYLGISAKMIRGLVAIAVGVLIFGTSVWAYDGMIRHQKIPAIDAEILAAAALIKQDCPNYTPTVLSDCPTAVTLPAFAGARVYSGHPAMTPEFAAKCRELELAGLGEQAVFNSGFDKSRLEDIMARTKPDFILVRRGTSAEQWLLEHHVASANMTGQRWSLLVTRK